MSEVVIERRQMPVDSVEVRQDDGVVHFKGHAAVFDSLTDIGPFRERVAQGAFKRSINMGGKVTLLFNHSEDSVMASTRSGTLRLAEDKRGLATEAELDPADTDVQRVLPKMKRGDLDRMSFAFRVAGPQGDEWDDHPEDGGKPIRTLKDLQLFDVSVVTSPAYDATDASVRASAEKAYERRMETLKVEDPEEITPEVLEVEAPEDPEDPPDEPQERTDPQDDGDSPRDEHALAERQALRDRRIAILERQLKGE